MRQIPGVDMSIHAAPAPRKARPLAGFIVSAICRWIVWHLRVALPVGLGDHPAVVQTMSDRCDMARQGWRFAIGFQAQQPPQEGAEMIDSDEDLREAEEELEGGSKESDPSDNASQPDVLSDFAHSLPEDVAKKILRDAFKHFPIPGKK
jgi:hypothetical protein